MLTKDFIEIYGPCEEGARWAFSVSADMADVWDALIKEKKIAWLTWLVTREGLYTPQQSLKLMCRLIREVRLLDGRTVWDLFQDDSYRAYIEFIERYAEGALSEQDYFKLRPMQPHTRLSIPIPHSSLDDDYARVAVHALTHSYVEGAVLSIVRASAAAAKEEIPAIEDILRFSRVGMAAKMAITEQIRIISGLGYPFQDPHEKEGDHHVEEDESA